jgi:hypothetical protein
MTLLNTNGRLVYYIRLEVIGDQSTSSALKDQPIDDFAK